MSGDHNMYGSTTISPVRTIEDRSQGFRWLVKKDGSFVLQVACPVQHGFNTSIEWRDIPTVQESN